MTAAEAEADLARKLRLRGPAPVPVRLSRRAAIVAAGLAPVLIAAVCAWALTARPTARTEPSDTTAASAVAPPPEPLAALPKDYLRPAPSDFPRLGPPLPPVVGHTPTGPAADSARTSSPSGTGLPATGAAVRDSESSRLFVMASAPTAAAPVTPVTSPEPGRLASFATIRAGVMLKAALLTALRSDVPGPALAEVTEAVADAETGQVLVPAGARLVGAYIRAASIGQDRIAVTFSRLDLPDGSGVDLGSLTALDAQGRAGLPGRVHAHWGDPLRGAALALGLGLAGELAAEGEGVLGSALGRGVQDTAVLAGSQLIGRGLQAPPSIEVAAGEVVRVILARDLVLPIEATAPDLIVEAATSNAVPVGPAGPLVPPPGVGDAPGEHGLGGEDAAAQTFGAALDVRGPV